VRPTISIIGAGNVGWHLLRTFSIAGYDVLEVYGRKPEEAHLFECFGKTKYISQMEVLSDFADVYILCVSDDAIVEVIDQLPFDIEDSQIFVHTSGTKPSSILSPFASRYGCFWPLQTLTKGQELVSDEMPIIISGSDIKTIALLSDLASDISGIYHCIPDDKKQQMHLMAVILNNFTNHLYGIVYDHAEPQGINFEFFSSLITETALKTEFTNPNDVQTGPARRNDTTTIEQHLSLLENNPALYKLYCTFTESITKKYHKK
jgi:predicted short-subunit dehydrogenase-like oxidoreductase (DUF2520 family)